jgi:ferredoxin
MALIITEECTSCGACVEDCPNEAISEGDPVYVIDPEKCTECAGFFDEPQCITVCPIECIVADPAHQETKEELLAKKARLHPE